MRSKHKIAIVILLNIFFINSALLPQSIKAVADTVEKAYNKYDFYNPDYGSGYYPFKEKNEKRFNPVKPYWLPLSEAIGFNLLLGAFNRYVMNSEFAHISWESIRNNFNNGFKWDADALITNMWAHPFQGSVYHNFARSSGYGYWTSLTVSTLGSLQWEFFMETEPPAINDLIMTSLAGSMYGEVFYRMSNLILDDRTHGSERFFRELGAGFFNPGRLFNRLLFKRVKRSTSEQIYFRERYFGMIDIGLSNVANGPSFKDGLKNKFLALYFTYGEPFYKNITRPFSFFRFYTLINFGNVQPLLGQFRIYGTLYSKRKSYGNGNQLLWGLFQNTDYLNNNIYEIGGVSLGPGVGFRTKRKVPYQFAGIFNVSFMPMGAANSDYAPGFEVGDLDSSRTYNMGLGMQVKIDLNFKFPYGQFVVVQTFWWVHTLDGAPGDEYIGLLWPKLTFHIYSRLHIGFEYIVYHRRGRYNSFPDIDLRNNEKRFSVSIRF